MTAYNKKTNGFVNVIVKYGMMAYFCSFQLILAPVTDVKMTCLSFLFSDVLEIWKWLQLQFLLMILIP